jgi:hypothetical protein
VAGLRAPGRSAPPPSRAPPYSAGREGRAAGLAKAAQQAAEPRANGKSPRLVFPVARSGPSPASSP